MSEPTITLPHGTSPADVEPSWRADLLGLALCVGRLRGETDPETRANPHAALIHAGAVLLARAGLLEAIAEWSSGPVPQILARFAFPLDNGFAVHCRWAVDRGTPLATALQDLAPRRLTEAEEQAAGHERHKALWQRYAADVADAAALVRHVLDRAEVEPDAPAVAAFTLAPRHARAAAVQPFGPLTPRLERRRRLAELRAIAATSDGVQIAEGTPLPCALCGGGRRRWLALALAVGTTPLCASCAHSVDPETPERLRRIARAAQRATWRANGGPVGRWPVNLVSTYLGSWFD